ncbi:MAG: TRAP transporter large permease subunit [Piscinibacter sp.]|uniref:TRAP transporter large permease n=1 Tax=Piscinibacter sp. TaxID=1903157 RepID=UPI002583F5B6|nr:TRAP transporter large permease subunit [Piscinibacter sp.]MCW5663693.1 TRAP transporter large permease subunit [Piscinibacter sp.]
MSAEVLAPAMFAALAVALLLGFPVAFSVAAVAAVFGVLGIAGGHFQPAFLLAGTLRIEGFFHNDNLLAIPLFVFMGLLLERTGLAADMLRALDELLAGVRGGMAYTVVMVGASLSALTGFVSAAVIGLGLIALPAMLRHGYDARLATGVVAASGTLAQILPPSLVLIVLAEQLEVPLMDIFRGAMLPSALLVLLYLLYIFFASRWWPSRVPPLPSREHLRPIAQRGMAALIAAGFPIGLILLVLASVYFGWATPSEGGAVGVTGAFALGLVRRKLDLSRLRQAMMAAGVLCSGLLFLLFGASFFTLVFRGIDGQVWIESMFQHLPAGQLGFLVFINIAIFFIAFFLDFFEIAFIVLPLIAPVARKMGIDMTWLAVLLAVNLQTSFMHPPFGIALYNLRSVTPAAVPTSQIYRGAIPFLILQLALVALLIAFPSIVLKTPTALVNIDNVEIPMPPKDYGAPERE